MPSERRCASSRATWSACVGSAVKVFSSPPNECGSVRERDHATGPPCGRKQQHAAGGGLGGSIGSAHRGVNGFSMAHRAVRAGRREGILGRVRRPEHRLLIAAAIAIAAAAIAAAAFAGGPPYPSPVTGQRVYDTADVLSDATKAQAEAIIGRIEQRSAAQVVVYTQVKPESDTEAAAEADARALIDQWGIGRKGFDDSLVILLDL